MKLAARFYQQQQGIALLTGLIFLVILTLIGIASMNTTALTEKSTQNMRDSSASFSSAESALGDGEQWVQNQSSIPTAVSSCSSAPCKVWQYNVLGSFYQQSDSWWQSTAIPFSGTIYNVAAQPYYIIEQYGFVPYNLSVDTESKGQGYYYYRVTSRGTGNTSSAHSVVQSIYGTVFN